MGMTLGVDWVCCVVEAVGLVFNDIVVLKGWGRTVHKVCYEK